MVTNLTNLTRRGMLAAFAAGGRKGERKVIPAVHEGCRLQVPLLPPRRPPQDAKAEGEAQAGGACVAQDAAGTRR